VIKPEDIPGSSFVYGDIELTGEDLAFFLNLAIYLNVVSPPVWVARSTVSGKLLNQTSRKFIEPDGDYTYEHFKGQTE
jgi:hypothetical protein